MQTSAPFGLRPVYHPTGLDRAEALTNGIASAYNSNIFKGSPIYLLPNNGVINVSAVNQDFLGAFAGVEYTDSSGRWRVSNWWAAGTVIGSNGPPAIAYYYDDALIMYEIQAAATMTQIVIGNQADFSSPGTGSTGTGISSAMIGAVVGSGVQGQLRIQGLAPYQDNAWGDTYPILRVSVARSQFFSNKVAI